LASPFLFHPLFTFILRTLKDYLRGLFIH